MGRFQGVDRQGTWQLATTRVSILHPVARVALLSFALLGAGALPLADRAVAETVVLTAPALPDSVVLQEPPALTEAVAKGELPAIAERMPRPVLLTPETAVRQAGKSGGDLKTLVTRAKDTRLFSVFGYARLVGYDEALSIVPDIAEKVEIVDGRVFTFTLRKGHRWSDGHPFTTEDFRYFWEDVANNDELFPTGPPVLLTVEGVPASVEVIDEVTVRYSWPEPNPFFLPRLAGAVPQFIFRPAHYMRKFHRKYGDPDFIAKEVEAAGARNWAQLHNRRDNMSKFDNPDLPTLQPWYNTVAPPTTRFIGKRNPYYHRADGLGQQLPYLDKFVFQVTGSGLVPAKTGAGESNIQARGLGFTDYTFLKESEERSEFDVRLWKTARGSQLALYPNMNAADPVWRALARDVRYRRALSLSIDRDELNAVIYYGLCLPGNNMVLPASPLYDEERHQRWAQFDPELANDLLDEIGLTERNEEGIRLLPNGELLEILVETAGENTEEVDVLELIHDSWLDVGVKLFTKPSQREVLRNRVYSGEAVMSIWFGYDNGVPTADMSPAEFVPVSQDSFHWPKWGQFRQTRGMSGEAVDMPIPQKLLELNEAWIKAPNSAEREKIWLEILEIHAEQVFTIGLVGEVPQPVVVAKGLKNVPEEGLFNWDPGAQFGMHRPDTFYWDR